MDAKSSAHKKAQKQTNKQKKSKMLEFIGLEMHVCHSGGTISFTFQENQFGAEEKL